LTIRPTQLKESATVIQVSNIVVVPHKVRTMSPRNVLALYQVQTWWPEYTAEHVVTVLRETPTVGAWLDDELVGFARAITDGIRHAYVEDVLVAHGQRGTGVGRALIGGLVELLAPLAVITVCCPPDLAPFYEASGFEATKQVVLYAP
jgi:GNAT superfamily N-acetyltransferase